MAAWHHDCIGLAKDFQKIILEILARYSVCKHLFVSLFGVF